YGLKALEDIYSEIAETYNVDAQGKLVLIDKHRIDNVVLSRDLNGAALTYVYTDITYNENGGLDSKKVVYRTSTELDEYSNETKVSQVEEAYSYINGAWIRSEKLEKTLTNTYYYEGENFGKIKTSYQTTVNVEKDYYEEISLSITEYDGDNQKVSILDKKKYRGLNNTGEEVEHTVTASNNTYEKDR
ncbi:hypothetical protein KKC59_01565, partial [bacterium]|nr:hypothetical protein [bacterium]